MSSASKICTAKNGFPSSAFAKAITALTATLVFEHSAKGDWYVANDAGHPDWNRAAVGLVQDFSISDGQVQINDSGTLTGFGSESATTTGLAFASISAPGWAHKASGTIDVTSSTPPHQHSGASNDFLGAVSEGAISEIDQDDPADIHITAVVSYRGNGLNDTWNVGNGLAVGSGTGKTIAYGVGTFAFRATAQSKWSSNTANNFSRVIMHYSAIQGGLSTANPHDFDGDALVDQLDLTMANFGIGGTDMKYDVNSDSSVTSADVDAILSTFGTVRGDINLDHMVSFSDLTTLAANYNKPGTWFEGDFDGDGDVDFADQVTLAGNYHWGEPGYRRSGTGIPSDFAADWALAQSMVPEPTTLGAIGGLATLALRRRR